MVEGTPLLREHARKNVHRRFESVRLRHRPYIQPTINMRTIVVALCAFVTGALAQSTSELAQLATLPPLRVSVYGTALTGERELVPTMAGKNNAEQEQLFKAALRLVRMGESFQLTVQTVNGETVTSNPTPSMRLTAA